MVAFYAINSLRAGTWSYDVDHRCAMLLHSLSFHWPFSRSSWLLKFMSQEFSIWAGSFRNQTQGGALPLTKLWWWGSYFLLAFTMVLSLNLGLVIDLYARTKSPGETPGVTSIDVDDLVDNVLFSELQRKLVGYEEPSFSWVIKTSSCPLAVKNSWSIFKSLLRIKLVYISFLSLLKYYLYD